MKNRFLRICLHIRPKAVILILSGIIIRCCCALLFLRRKRIPNGGFDMDCKFTTELGLVTVNDDVLVRVAGYAALDCYGIVGMASKRSTDGIVQLMGKENLGRGVKIRTSGDKVDIDLFIIVEYGISISAVAASIIETVKYKVEHLTGVPVGRVNVCVEDIRV